jgi:non-lysosomal glucosylceramidase
VSWLGAGTAAAFLARPAWGSFELPTAEIEQWRRSLFERSEPRRYSSAKHKDARMHLGGIGTGNFEIGSDGQFTSWQLFNTLRDGYVPFHFAVRAGSVHKLLQTTGGPDWPRVREIEMTGDYPIATLRFGDPDLPVEIELEAFSPFAPLDSRFSSMPAACCIFRLRNKRRQKQKISLGAFLQNPVGYEALVKNSGTVNPCFGSNLNEVIREGEAAGLFLRAIAGSEPKLDRPVMIYTLPNLGQLKTPPRDRPPELSVQILERQSAEDIRVPGDAVIWLEEAPANLQPVTLTRAAEAVRAGATLVFSGKSLPLLTAFASWTGGKPVDQVQTRPDVLFEDFEHGYGSWKVEGGAFGRMPAKGTLPNQQPVSGFLGKGLVNTYLEGDDTVGRISSKDFKIERHFIRFLVGGGQHTNTQIRLVVDGKIVRATAGKDNERLEPASWAVSEFEGQTAHIEIVDDQKGGWGHINVDQIEFSDSPGNEGLMRILDELLPARFSKVGPKPAGIGAGLEFTNISLKTNATERKADLPQAPTGEKTPLLSWMLGKGRVVIIGGPILDPSQAGLGGPRQRAYQFICGLMGATYTPSNGQNPKAPGYGSLALVAIAPSARVLPAFDEWKDALDFLGAETTPAANSSAPTVEGRTVNGAVAVTVSVPAEKTVEIPFLLTWQYPNKYGTGQVDPAWIGTHYATTWPDARAVAREAAGQFEQIRKRTELFRQIVYDSSLPWWLLDCLTANAAILRHIGVVFRTANGDVYGWEGSNGCCQPTCTHVWGYEQTLARLFPDLEKDMRRIDFKHQQRKDGGVNNRTDVPSPPHPTGEQPFADGHASCILKAYREALNHSDQGFMTEYWPHIKSGVEYLIARDAKTANGEPAGILQDDQWNTYDEALHGVTTFISGYYLAALRAGEEWARRMGDIASADRFHRVFEKGNRKLVELCWNGEYFQQHLPDYMNRQGEVGPGCMSDQLIGQWWAHQLGLGYILPREQVVAALRSVYKHNFKTDLTGWKHAPRAFAGDKDKGLIICTWPKGGRPSGVMLYSDEVWTGIEYQVAAHMIYEGLVEEGFAIVKAARDRYDGIPRAPIQRNPWNEIECGGHYARAMSSWSLLLAVSGWEYDGPRHVLRFTPRHTPENFRSFFAGPEGWGSASQSRKAGMQRNEFGVKEGSLVVQDLFLVPGATPAKVVVKHSGKTVQQTFGFAEGKLHISFKDPIRIKAGQALEVKTTND